MQLMQRVISLLDHCRVMLKWEGLLPEILNSVRKKSTPGKKSRTQQALRGPSMAEMVVEMKNATHKLAAVIEATPKTCTSLHCSCRIQLWEEGDCCLRYLYFLVLSGAVTDRWL